MTTIYAKHLKREWLDDVSKILLPHHLKDLRKSGLSDETILEARIYSVTSPEARMLLNRTKEVGPGYVIPYPRRSGFGIELNFRLDNPLLNTEGKLIKYLRPNYSRQHFYIPRPVWAVLRNVKIPLIFTEGEKKALRAAQEEFYAIGLSGVWNWLADQRPIEDFGLINLKGRKVYIAFDSDKYTNPQVLEAEKRLAKFLNSIGAQVAIVDLK